MKDKGGTMKPEIDGYKPETSGCGPHWPDAKPEPGD